MPLSSRAASRSLFPILENLFDPHLASILKTLKTVNDVCRHFVKKSFHRFVCELSSPGSSLGFSAAGFRRYLAFYTRQCSLKLLLFMQNQHFCVASTKHGLIITCNAFSVLYAGCEEEVVHLFSSYFSPKKDKLRFLFFFFSLFPHQSKPGCISSIVSPN